MTTGQEFVDLRNIPRHELRALDCPLCKSIQVQICADSNNPMKNFAKCRECGCQAPLSSWNDLVMRATPENK